jgi:hypothetical protein
MWLANYGTSEAIYLCNVVEKIHQNFRPKIAPIQDYHRPTIIKELQAFLGMVNFYRRFLPSIARTLRPLTDSLRGGRKGADKLEWSAAMDAAFAGAKQALLSATHLAHPTVGAELSVVVDTSATHAGACLQQLLPGRKDWQPLRFFSKKLEAAQQKYFAFDRELFACYSGIWHFRYRLDGRRFAIFSWTTNRSPMLWQGCLTLGQQASPGSCPTWQSIHQISATSPGQPTWSQTLSPGRPAMRWRRGLPRW